MGVAFGPEADEIPYDSRSSHSLFHCADHPKNSRSLYALPDTPSTTLTGYVAYQIRAKNIAYLINAGVRIL